MKRGNSPAAKLKNLFSRNTPMPTIGEQSSENEEELQHNENRSNRRMTMYQDHAEQLLNSTGIHDNEPTLLYSHGQPTPRVSDIGYPPGQMEEFRTVISDMQRQIDGTRSGDETINTTLTNLSRQLAQLSTTIQSQQTQQSIITDDTITEQISNYTKAISDTHRKTNLTTALLSDITIFDGKDAAKLDDWITDIETAADLLNESRSRLAEAKSRGLARTMIREANNARKSWKEIQEILRLKLCNANVHTYTSNFMEIKQKENESLAAYVHRFYTEASRCNFTNDAALVRIFLKGLKHMKEIAAKVYESDPKTIKEAVAVVEKLNAAVILSKTLASSSINMMSDDSPCYNCNKTGHMARYCPDAECYECGELGHYSRDCPDAIPSSQNTSNDRRDNQIRRREREQKRRGRQEDRGTNRDRSASTNFRSSRDKRSDRSQSRHRSRDNRSRERYRNDRSSSRQSRQSRSTSRRSRGRHDTPHRRRGDSSRDSRVNTRDSRSSRRDSRKHDRDYSTDRSADRSRSRSTHHQRKSTSSRSSREDRKSSGKTRTPRRVQIQEPSSDEYTTDSGDDSDSLNY